MQILFIPSNENQIRIMAPIATLLEEQGNNVTFLSLDHYYNQHTDRALWQQTFSWQSLGESQQTTRWWELTSDEQFQLLGKAIVDLEDIFAKLSVDAIILGNSLGELEQVAMKVANRFGIPAALIQDGVITNLLPEVAEGQHLLSVLTGPADLIFTWNELLKTQIQERRATPGLLAVGSPRYDAVVKDYRHKVATPPYTIMVATQCYTNYKMQRAVDEISMYERIVNRILARPDVGKVILRPHPQTNIIPRYQELVARLSPRVELQLSGDSLAAVQQVDCVVVTFSTVLVEACILGIPIVELSYLSHSDTDEFLAFDQQFTSWLNSETFPSNFFSTRAETTNSFKDQFCPIADGRATQQIVSTLSQMVRGRQQATSEKPRCTVITELHQLDPLLSLNAILGDKSCPVEVIAIDRSQTARAIKLVEPIFKNDNRVRLLHLSGMTKVAALSKAITESKSDYLVLLDQSSFLLPGTISFVESMFESSPKINCFLASVAIAADEGVIAQVVSRDNKNSFSEFLSEQMAGALIKALFIRKSGLSLQLPIQCPDNEFEFHLLNNLVQTSQDKRVIISPKMLSSYPYITRVDHSKAYQAVEKIKNTVQQPAASVNNLADKLLGTPAPEISILLCSYNREQKVGRCLEALANQSIDSSRYEVICVNDGSTDATGAQMKAGLKGLRGRYIEHESNKALAAARNTAIAAATGKYLLFINDDTYATPTFLEEHLKTHQLHSGKDIAVAGYLPFIEAYKNRVFSLALMDANLYFGYNGLPTNQALPFWFFITGNLSVGRHLFTKDNIRFDESFIRYGYEDIECGYRLWQKGLNVYYNPQAQAIHDHLLTIENFISREENNAVNILQFCAMHPDPILAENLMTTKRLNHASIQQWSDFVEGSRPRIPEIIAQISDVQEIIAQMDSPEARARAQHLIKEVGESTRLVALWVKLNTFLEVFKQHPSLKEVLLSDSWAAQAQKKFQEIGYDAML